MKKVPHDWYRQAFGANYLERYAHRDESEAESQVSWIEGILNFKGSDRILDACCGAGRHLKVLRAHGKQAYGFDLSGDLLRQVQGPCAQADQRCWPFASEVFDAVLLMFTSLGYFVDDQENFLVFDEIARCLTPGGQFLIDAIDPEKIKENFKETTQKKLPNGILEENRWFENNRVCKEIIWQTDQSKQQYFESVRLFQREELSTICQERGLEITNIEIGIPPAKDRLVLIGKRL